MSLLPFSKSLEHKKTKHWTLGIASKHRLSWSRRTINQSAENEGSIRNQAKNDRETGPPYGEQEIKRPYDQCATINTTRNFQEHKQWDQSGNNDWEVNCEDMESDIYSWVATEMAGTEAVMPTHCIHRTRLSRPLNITLSPDALTSSSLDEITSDSHQTVDAFTQVPITPEESFALLLDYQSSSDTFLNDSVHPHAQGTHPATFPIYAHMHNANPEWHDLVDRAFCNSLTKQEQRRQGLWWELIKGEREYVRDMGIVCNVFMQSLRDCRPPVIEPARLELFSVEVFSNAAQIYHAHIKILKRLMERQRQEWPLLATATDIFLQSLLEIADLYDAYMKNYPFAQASVRRELATNDAFQQFINSCTTASLTYKRDIFVFLSRPVTRFPRMLLILDALLRATPVDHSDCDDIPVLKELLERVVKSSQPGIESAEGKIKLWNTAERLLFRKGEIVDLDISDPKRRLIHMGHVLQRVRNETYWHGWQDIQAILLDNYLLLTHSDDDGSLVVVSRPVHLDFINIVAKNGVSERRYDYVFSKIQRGGRRIESMLPTESLMFPFIILAEENPTRSFTLCVGTEKERLKWVGKIEEAKSLRKFDMESNRSFVVDTITTPLAITDCLTCADIFKIHDRDTVALSTFNSIWVGWLRDSLSFRQLIKFESGHITTVAVSEDSGWMLVISSGILYAFGLKELIPTSEPSTWNVKSQRQGEILSRQGQTVIWVCTGETKGKTLVAYATYSKSSHVTQLEFLEPLPGNTFRLFAQSLSTLNLPGYASCLTFFRQTVAVITEKSIIIVDPGSSTYHCVPAPGSANSLGEDAPVLKLLSSVGRKKSGTKPLGMWQTGGNEFVLVYDWGACFVTKYGELCRLGAFLKWNIVPSYAFYSPPYLLLFDEHYYRVEVRVAITGKMCEVVEEKGLRMIPWSREGQAMIGWSQRGLIRLVETEAIQS
ncbi:hypothetical protein L204_100396 [Cryptococcus depauperatus]